MPHIENDAVPLGNGPVVERFGTDHVEQCVSFRARLEEPREKHAAVVGCR